MLSPASIILDPTFLFKYTGEFFRRQGLGKSLLAPLFFGALGFRVGELGLPRGEAFALSDSAKTALLDRVEESRQAANEQV